MFRLARTVVCVLFASAAAQAQITTSKINVSVSGEHCSEMKDVYLIIDGDDFNGRWVKLKNVEDCQWTKNLTDTLSTALSYFSLRFNFGRTDCHKAIPDLGEFAAKLEFVCCSPARLRNLSLNIEPQMPVSYIRDVHKNPQSRIGAIDCVEFGTFLEGTGEIQRTQFSDEKIYLQLGRTKANRRKLGLPLNDLAGGRDALVLTRDGLTFELAAYRAKGRTNTPTLSSNAISIDLKQFDQLKLKSVEFAVIK